MALAPAGYAAQETVLANVSSNVSGLATDATGNIYLYDAQNQQIDKFAPSGASLGGWTVAGNASQGSIAVSPFNGNVYVGVYAGVDEYTPAGTLVKSLSQPLPTTCASGTSYTSPIAVAADGSVYLGSEDCIRKYSPELELQTEFGGAERFTGLSGIAVTPSGRVYATDLGNRVQEFDSSGNYLGQWGGNVPYGGMGTMGAAISSTRSGNLMVTLFGHGGRSTEPPYGLLRGDVAELRAPTGQPLGTYTWEGFGGTSGIVEGPTGMLYAVGQRTLLAIDPTEPTASLTIDPKAWVLTGQTVNLDARESRAVFSSPTFAWDLGTGSFGTSTGTTGTTSASFQTPGVETLSVRVSAASGKTATATQQIEVRPSPPPGQVGVTVDDGDYATNSRNVTVEPVWFPGSTNIVLANDGGFRGSAPQTLGAEIPWQLAPGGTEKLPKTVYVRFTGAGQDTATFTDDIVLDTTSPVVEAAEAPASGSAGNTYPVKVSAQAAISGVSAVAIGTTKGTAKTTVLREASTRGIPKLRKTFKFKSKKAPKFVRVRNAAGTWSKWMKIGPPGSRHKRPKAHPPAGSKPHKAKQ